MVTVDFRPSYGSLANSHRSTSPEWRTSANPYHILKQDSVVHTVSMAIPTAEAIPRATKVRILASDFPASSADCCCLHTTLGPAVSSTRLMGGHCDCFHLIDG